MLLRSMFFAVSGALLISSSDVIAQVSPTPANSPQKTPNPLGLIDIKTQVTVTGVVKFVHLAPKQSRIQLLVTDAQGRVQEWSLQGPTQSFLISLGTKQRPIAQWDHISLTLNPVLGRAAAGQITAITNANGVTQTSTSSPPSQ